MDISFLSYSRKDQVFALKLAEDLKKNHIKIWFDQLDISSGSLWDIEIENALKKCDILIVIISSNSVKSKNVLDEISYALEENKRIIPIKISDCEIPFRIRRLQHIDFSKDYNKGFENLLSNFNQKVVIGVSNFKKEKFLIGNYKIYLISILLIIISTILIKISINNKASISKDPAIENKPQLKSAINYDDRKFIFSETQAKAMSVVSMFPLAVDSYPEYSVSNLKKELEYHRHIQFKNNSAYISGIYNGENVSNNIIGTADLPYNIFDVNNFAISLNFKIETVNKSMPIFYIGENCRQFGAEISTSNMLFLTLNNTSKTIPTFAKIETNTWNEIIFIYTKKTILFYLNRELVSKYNYELNDCISLYEKKGIKILSVNNGNATAFNGYWNNLNIFTLHN